MTRGLSIAMRKLWIMGAAAAVALAACGSSGSSAAKPSSGSKPVGGGSSSTLQAKDFAYTPTAIQLTVGKAATIKVTNAGSVKHNLTVEGLKVSQDLPPGSTKTVTVTPKAGNYPFHCEYHPTQMKGTITVG